MGMPPASLSVRRLLPSAQHVRRPGPRGGGPAPDRGCSPRPHRARQHPPQMLSASSGLEAHTPPPPRPRPSPGCGFPGSSSPPPPALQAWGTRLPHAPARPHKPASNPEAAAGGLAPRTLPAPPATPASSPRPAGQRHAQTSLRESPSGPGDAQSTGGHDHAHPMHFPRMPAPAG